MSTTTTNKTKIVAHDLRLGALARELRIASKILNRDVTDLVIVEGGPAPAWTDLSKITLNKAQLPYAVDTAEGVATWVGAAMHELGHTLFTPRPGCELHARLDAAAKTVPGVRLVYNMVEDPRQERAVISRFAPMRGYLTAMAIDLILSKGDPKTAWPLVCGRTWLPREARAMVRAAWVAQRGEASAARVAELVGEYQDLTDPAHGVQALTAARVIVELTELLAQQSDRPGDPGGDPGDGQGEGDPIDGGEPRGCNAPDKRDGESIPTPEVSNVPNAADADEDLTDEGAGSGDEEGEGEGGDPAEGEGEGETEGDAEGGPEGTGTGEGEGGDPAEGETGSDTAGSDPNAPDAPTAKELREALNEAIGEVLAEPDVARDLGEYKAAVDDVIDPLGSEVTEADKFIEPDLPAQMLRDDLGDVLRELHAEALPGWERGTSSGRVNVRRLNAPALRTGTLFDRFTPDALRDTSMALAVLVDVSNSMQAQEGNMTRAVWAIRHAADDGHVDLKVIGFGARARVLATSEDRPAEMMPQVACRDGSTLPVDAVEAGYAWLRGTQAAHRVFLILSDGAWGGDVARAEAMIDLMTEEGMETLSLGFGPHPKARDPHHAARFTHLDTLSDLPVLIGEMVEARMRDGLAARR
jgi:hypothetical protein